MHVPTGKLTSQTKYTVELSRFSIFYARIPALRHNIIRLLIYPQTSEVVPCLACRESLKGFDALYHICFKGFCDCWSFWGVQYIYSFVLYCIDTVSTAESVNLSTEFTLKCPGNRPHYSMCSKSIPYHGTRTNLYIHLYLGHQRVLYAIRST